MSRTTLIKLFAFMLLAHMLVTTNAYTTKNQRAMDNIIDNFAESGSLDDFCEDFESEFGEECLPDLDATTEKEFLNTVTKGSRKDVTRFIKTRLLMHDDDLEMDERECTRFLRKAKVLKPSKFLEFLQNEMDERGYQLSTRLKRTSVLKKRIEEVMKVDSCNLGVFASMFGKYYKPIISPRQMYRTVHRYATDALGGSGCDSWDCHSEL